MRGEERPLSRPALSRASLQRHTVDAGTVKKSWLNLGVTNLWMLGPGRNAGNSLLKEVGFMKAQSSIKKDALYSWAFVVPPGLPVCTGRACCPLETT